MTARIMERLEPVMVESEPDAVVVYGDTNSTIAAALVAAKLMIPVAHVEAGLRSFDRRMPEEINRVVTDHLAALLFCPTDVAARNLAAEGVVDGVHVVGDVMVDCARLFGPVADRAAPTPARPTASRAASTRWRRCTATTTRASRRWAGSSRPSRRSTSRCCCRCTRAPARR